MAERDIEPIDRFTYRVKSDSGGHYYHVDLEAYNFGGFCDCSDFKCRREPRLSRGEKPTDALRCKHIRAARTYFLDEIFPILAKQLTKQK